MYSLSANKHPHPRGKALRSLLCNETLNANKRKRDEYEDRDDGTVLETYGEDKMHKLSKYYFDNGSERALRDRFDFLLGHSLIARGETTRHIQHPDGSLRELKAKRGAAREALIVIISR